METYRGAGSAIVGEDKRSRLKQSNNKRETSLPAVKYLLYGIKVKLVYV